LEETHERKRNHHSRQPKTFFSRARDMLCPPKTTKTQETAPNVGQITQGTSPEIPRHGRVPSPSASRQGVSPRSQDKNDIPVPLGETFLFSLVRVDFRFSGDVMVLSRVGRGSRQGSSTRKPGLDPQTSMGNDKMALTLLRPYFPVDGVRKRMLCLSERGSAVDFFSLVRLILNCLDVALVQHLCTGLKVCYTRRQG